MRPSKSLLTFWSLSGCEENKRFWRSPTLSEEEALINSQKQRDLEFEGFVRLNNGVKLAARKFVIVDSFIWAYKPTHSNSGKICDFKNAKVEIEGFNQGTGWWVKISKGERHTRISLQTEKEALTFKSMMKRYAVFNDIHSSYHTVRVLGRGAFAKVYLIKRKNDKKLFAAKVFNRETIQSCQLNSELLLNEIEILRELEHPNIVRFEELHETDNSIYLIHEYVNGKHIVDLQSKHGCDVQTRNASIPQIISALSYIHSKGIAHRDIKPDNILLSNSGVVKLIDFGLGIPSEKYEGLVSRLPRAGTPGFLDPELLTKTNDDSINNNYEKADIYSLGVVIYCMITGKNPFDLGCYDEIKSNNKKAEIDYNLNEFHQLSTPFEKNILTQILSKSPENRPGINELHDLVAIKNPFGESKKLMISTGENSSLTDIEEMECLEEGSSDIGDRLRQYTNSSLKFKCLKSISL